MEIRPVTNQQDLRLPNEAFSMPGQFIPALQDGKWSWRAEYWETPSEMRFPDEPYELEETQKNGLVLGAYEGDACIGLAIFRNGFFRYLYLEDLKVNGAFRGKGAGKALIKAGLEAARERGCRGIYATCQDNNLNACMFYLGCGFQIGGFDNRVYDGTSQEGKGDIQFYLE